MLACRTNKGTQSFACGPRKALRSLARPACNLQGTTCGLKKPFVGLRVMPDCDVSLSGEAIAATWDEI